jgi:hypothetical protein
VGVRTATVPGVLPEFATSTLPTTPRSIFGSVAARTKALTDGTMADRPDLGERRTWQEIFKTGIRYMTVL